MDKKSTNTTHYTLRSKNIPLISFSLFEYEEKEFGVTNKIYTIHIDKIYQENSTLLPKNLSEDITNESLEKWINRRKAPKNRQFVEKILSAFDDDSNPMRYVDVSHALSLNDAYWITRDDIDHKWEDYNLYDNPFDKSLSMVAFTGYSTKVSGLFTSPEVTSSGALKKCWSNREDGIYLIKGDDFAPRPDGRSQATNEFYAAQVAEVMGFEHINYDLEEFHHRDGSKEIVCLCKLFTSADEGFVEAATFFKENGIDVESSNIVKLSTQKQISDLFGADKYADMMLFDSLIANQDRHLGNFGMIIDNNTGKYLRPAPLFDNGFSLFYGAAVSDLKKENLPEYIKTLRCRYFTLDAQAQIFVQRRHLPNLHKLLQFEFKTHPHYNISDETLAAMSKFIQDRASRTIELYHQKNVAIDEKESAFIVNKIKEDLLDSKPLDKIQKDLLSQLPGSPAGKKLKIKKAIRILKNNPKLRKLITREESKER